MAQDSYYISTYVSVSARIQKALTLAMTCAGGSVNPLL